MSTSKATITQAAITDAPQYVSPAAAAKRWGVSVDTIRRLGSAGKITMRRLNGRIIRVDLAEVDACFRPIPTVRQAG